MICFVTAGVSVLSPELNLVHRMMSALPPFVPSSSQRVTNEQCIKDSQLYLQELRNLALWALKSEYFLMGSRVIKWKSPLCILPATAHEAPSSGNLESVFPHPLFHWSVTKCSKFKAGPSLLCANASVLWQTTKCTPCISVGCWDISEIKSRGKLWNLAMWCCVGWNDTYFEHYKGDC